MDCSGGAEGSFRLVEKVKPSFRNREMGAVKPQAPILFALVEKKI